MFKTIVAHIVLWRLQRKITRLEERFLSLRADMYRRESSR